MSLIAEFEASSRKLALGPTLEAFPDLEIDLERQYALDPDQPITFYWMQGVAVDELEAGLTRDETIADVERYEQIGDRVLYRIQRSQSRSRSRDADDPETTVIDAYREWTNLGAVLLESHGSNGRWEIRMRFPDRDTVATYHDFLEENGVTFDLHRLSDGVQTSHGDDVVTPRQREALQVAYENGFFDVPRGATLGELAAELEISDQAVSERLRRGQSRLLEHHVV
ncbi:helix-turn-helix domain-containing protein [Halobacteria archaeon AArc-m2/3/4]|uniref:Helix-turn-helix domain-containing protein n=1 Tax=Natronoglomus mannanivorans TaxID=2979990 RepID=A0AAP2YXM5_9EURY|nr:helix-turn-helix domain-containing protein [Halobacteria archaeon AArc-xg1-1]MCU4973369.1 helix-turn-helix domain-containing protein [Halobacteria archaeon AArc-m2/3/4]